MKAKNTTNRSILPQLVLDRLNLVVFLAGLVLLAVGFILLAVKPWDNPISLSVAPIVLLLGYLVVLPISIFLRSPQSRKDEKQTKRKD